MSEQSTDLAESAIRMKLSEQKGNIEDDLINKIIENIT
jgi:hypothetical protein